MRKNGIIIFMNNDKKYDVAVIGGGPAGLMAAGWAAQNGARAVLIEKNPILGRKLLITGKGRCNLTSAEEDSKKFIKTVGENGNFLHSALYAFGTKQTMDFFQNQGLAIKVERGQRVFPVSDKSYDVLSALEKFLQKGKVQIIKNQNVKDMVLKNNKIEKIILNDSEITAKNYIISTGGLSYPETGCQGDGYKWCEKMGHTINKTRPGLVPILVKEKWVKKIEGLSLKNVSISLWQNNKKQAEEFGEAIFTAKGLSGPIILNLSKVAGELLPLGDIEIKINFKPAITLQTLEKRLLTEIVQSPNEHYKNFLTRLLPQKMIPTFIELSKILPNQKIGQLTKENRKNILKLLTEFKLNILSLDGYEKAIITLGGVEPKEIDPKTMRSKIIENLFLAGEIIDVHGPTGGYNLQICFATGYLAGKNSAP